MQKILVPCDGSDNALRAVRHAARAGATDDGVQLDLLCVLDPMAPGLAGMVSPQDLARVQQQDAARILGPAMQLLDQAGVFYRTHVRVGSPANEIAGQAHESGCDAIVMGTRGLGPVAALMIGSVALRVVHLVNIPVTLIK